MCPNIVSDGQQGRILGLSPLDAPSVRMLGVNTLTNNYRSTTWVSTLLASTDMGPYEYLYVNTRTAIRLHPTISSYTVKVTDKNPAIKLCEYFFTPISWKIDIIAGFTGGK